MSWVISLTDRAFPGGHLNPDHLGVYIVRGPLPIRYPLGTSLVLYVGEGRIAHRIRAHAEGRGSPGVFAECLRGTRLRVTWGTTPTKDHAVTAESALLEAFRNLYGDLPWANVKPPHVASHPAPVWVQVRNNASVSALQLLSRPPLAVDQPQTPVAAVRPALRGAAHRDVAGWFIRVRDGASKDHPGWMRDVFVLGSQELEQRKSSGDIIAAMELLFRSDRARFASKVQHLLDEWPS